MSIMAKQVRAAVVGEIRNFTVDAQDLLDTSETFTAGIPTITEATTTITLTNKLINDGPITVNGRSVAVGQGFQFTGNFASAVAYTTYTVNLSHTTSGSQTIIMGLEIYVTAAPA